MSAATSGRTRIGERADCTVHAFSNATGCHYEKAHAALAANGRRKSCRYRLHQHAHDVGRTLGVKLELVRRSGTLRRFLSDYPQGRFIVRVSGHAFAVVDGSVIDRTEQSPDRHIKHAWRVEA